MTIVVSLNHSRLEQRFEDVEALTFHPEKAPFQQWTKYAEEGSWSEEFVNINPTLVTISDITIIHGALWVFGKTV